MLADFGYASLLIAFFVSIYAGVAALIGARREDVRWVSSARSATIAVFPLVLAACCILWAAILTNDFSIQYVWRVTSIETPTYLKFTALWGNQAGSLLFWNMLLSLFIALAMLRRWEDNRALMPYVIVTFTLVQVFFLSLSAGLENPFVRFDIVPTDGNGLNPLLRHPGMIIHPPMLYLGFVGFVVPFAFGIAALATGRLDDTWIRITRRWTLIAWLFLSLGLVLGGRWAYDVLGWGGYWAWDPVENASFMPWLAGTAFLHSVMIQEKRNMFRAWNMFLIILTFMLVIYGTFIVRTGIISSVHSFAESPIGNYFFAYLAVMAIFSFVMLAARWPELATNNRLRSLLSREAAFLFNNYVILGILAAVFWGTNYPIISQIFTGTELTVGEPYYEKVTGPLFLLLLVLMGVAPLTMWHRTSAKRLEIQLRYPIAASTIVVILIFAFGVRSWGALLGFWVAGFAGIMTLLEFWRGTRARMKRGEPAWTAFGRLMARNRRRYGGYWIHMGVVIMAFGIIGSEMFQQERQILLNVNETAELGRYTVLFLGTETFESIDDLVITEATLALFDGDEFVKELNPRRELYTRTNQPMTIPDLRATVGEDFYVLMIDWEGITATSATFRLYLNPLINWVWAGGFIFMFGTLIAAWPTAMEVRRSSVVRVQSGRKETALAPGD